MRASGKPARARRSSASPATLRPGTRTLRASATHGTLPPFAATAAGLATLATLACTTPPPPTAQPPTPPAHPGAPRARASPFTQTCTPASGCKAPAIRMRGIQSLTLPKPSFTRAAASRSALLACSIARPRLRWLSAARGRAYYKLPWKTSMALVKFKLSLCAHIAHISAASFASPLRMSSS